MVPRGEIERIYKCAVKTGDTDNPDYREQKDPLLPQAHKRKKKKRERKKGRKKGRNKERKKEDENGTFATAHFCV